MKKIAAIALAFLLAGSGVNLPARASENADNINDNINNDHNYDVNILSDIGAASDSSYRNYLSVNADRELIFMNSVSVSVDKFTASDNAECEISTDADSFGMLYWKGTGEVSWEFVTDAEGLYCLEMNWFSQSGNNSYVSFGIEIDGEYPFDEAREVRFYRYWKNRTSIRLDSEHKNQLLPELVRYDTRITSFARSESASDAPLMFGLSKGEHTLTLHGVSTDFYIGALRFCADEKTEAYGAVRPSSEQLSQTPALIDGNPILIEAEMPKYTNSAVLRPTSEPADCAVSPSHPTYTRYNTIGADSWNSAGQTLFYEVTVPNEGYYALNMKCRVNSGMGLPSYRRISVNGEVPCEELNAVKLPYSTDWQAVSPRTDANELIFVYLKAGRNTVALEAVNGASGETLRELGVLVCELTSLAGGDNIDRINFGYYEAEILSAKEKLENAAGKGLNTPELDMLAKLLKSYESKPPENFSELKKCLGTVVGWIKNNQSSSVEMDYFELRTIHEEFRSISRGFFKQLWFNLQRFWGSFFQNGSDKSENAVSIAADKAAASILDSAGYSGAIRVYEGKGSLVEAALSGNAPDVALFVDANEVYELASRGLIVNFASFSDYDRAELLSLAGVTDFYGANGGVYGIPLTASFPMMFCRDDILGALGLSAPSSWEELEEMLPVLKANGLTAGLGSPLSSGLSASSAYMMMLLQSGEYENGLPSLSELNSGAAKTAFARYVNFYKEYGCPIEYDAISLFESGKMPIVIADYAEFYGQLSRSDKIRGLWSMAHVPGTYRASQSGRQTLDHGAGANTLGAVIFADSDNITEAWEFIKWFIQPEVQTDFGVMREAYSSEIYAAANFAVVSELRQSEPEYRALSAQAQRISKMPKGEPLYLFDRAVSSAFAEAMDGKLTPEEAISRYAN